MARRLTQEVVEVPGQLATNAINRRFTQIVIEVPIQNPVFPFGETPQVQYPIWSPAYTQPPVEGEALNYASYGGIHQHVIGLGRRREWQQVKRR